MNLVTSLSVERVNTHHCLFWPHGVQQLVVLVWQPDRNSDLLIAYGIDPGPAMGHGRSRIVLEAEFRLPKLGAFIKSMIDRVEGDIRDICHRIAALAEHHDHVAISDPTKHAVRLTSLALAASLRAEERLAEAVVHPSPPRDPSPPEEQPVPR